ncbi:hypothetical protein ACHAP5_009771 [Fusarium lateritium]
MNCSTDAAPQIAQAIRSRDQDHKWKFGGRKLPKGTTPQPKKVYVPVRRPRGCPLGTGTKKVTISKIKAKSATRKEDVAPNERRKHPHKDVTADPDTETRKKQARKPKARSWNWIKKNSFGGFTDRQWL